MYSTSALCENTARGFCPLRRSRAAKEKEALNPARIGREKRAKMMLKNACNNPPRRATTHEKLFSPERSPETATLNRRRRFENIHGREPPSWRKYRTWGFALAADAQHVGALRKHRTQDFAPCVAQGRRKRKGRRTKCTQTSPLFRRSAPEICSRDTMRRLQKTLCAEGSANSNGSGQNFQKNGAIGDLAANVNLLNILSFTIFGHS